LVFGIENSKRL